MSKRRRKKKRINRKPNRQYNRNQKQMQRNVKELGGGFLHRKGYLKRVLAEESCGGAGNVIGRV